MNERIHGLRIATLLLVAGILLIGCSSKDREPSKTMMATSSSGAASPVPAPAAKATLPTVYVPDAVATVITTCNIEQFDKTSFQSAPAEVSGSIAHSVSGWIDAPQFSAADFWLRLDDKAKGRYFQVKVTRSIRRPDVASSGGKTHLREISGFILNLPNNAVPTGRYHLYLVAGENDKPSVVCDDGRQVDFK
ncbi:MAG: hypothetical protein EPN56_04665 [Rhodanobacter sp.]|nr:MAG: hypothetical protein EPN56_04665 [Rhodanobacter sp.]